MQVCSCKELTSPFHYIDCGYNFTLAHGQANFTYAKTTYKETVPVVCDQGYKLHGGLSTECLEDGTWSQHVSCEMIGKHLAYPGL